VNAVELSSCQDQTDWQCSSKVQQLGRLTSDLHRPNMTFWPASATFIDLPAPSYGSEGRSRAACPDQRATVGSPYELTRSCGMAHASYPSETLILLTTATRNGFGSTSVVLGPPARTLIAERGQPSGGGRAHSRRSARGFLSFRGTVVQR